MSNEYIAAKCLVDGSGNPLYVPATAIVGAAIQLQEAGPGVNTVQLRAAAVFAANAIYSIPDVGVSASILMDAGAQTITGAKTLGAGGSLALNQGGITGIFQSREVACTGAPQNVAHGLPRTPSFVAVVPSSGNDGAGGAGTQFTNIIAVSASGTNVTFTGTGGGKADVYAF